MEKKNIVLSLGIAFAALGAGTLALSFGTTSLALKAGNETERTHTIFFGADDITAGAYDEDLYARPISLHLDDAYDDGNGTTYDIDSVPLDPETFSGTYFYGPENNITFGGDYLISFTDTNSESVSVAFRLVKKANLDLDASFLSFYLNGTYDNSNKFALEDESDPVYNAYKVQADFYSYYGKTIQVSEIKLVFSCPK